MPAEITMPQLSDTMTEGTLMKWVKREGDKVKAGEVVAEIETDKATMEMETSEAGVLAALVAQPGQKIKVGGVIAALATGKDDPAEVKKQYAGGGGAAAGASAPRKPAAQPAATGGAAPSNAGPYPTNDQGGAATMAGASIGEMHEPGNVEHHKAHASTVAVAENPPRITHDGGGGGNGHGAGRVRVSPLAKRIAAERNVDLAAVTGSGPGGRIVQKDVLAFVEGGAAAKRAAPAAAEARPSPAPVMGGGEKRVIPMTKMRTAIAAALQRSKQNVPHFYETIDVDVEALSEMRERVNAKLEKEKVRLSVADFITKAVVHALQRHPVLNARFDAQKNEITQYGDVNLGIAVAIPDGLIVPVLRAVNGMGLKEIRTRTADLVERARAQRLRKEESTEGTFTISSLGTFGIREFSAIINPPEVGILAVGAAEQRAVVREGQVVARTMLTVTLSCDHRVVDGATAAEFLRTLKDALEEPGMLLV